MNRNTINDEGVARSVPHGGYGADGLTVGCENDSSTHFYADQLLADATDSAAQGFSRGRGHGWIPRVSAGRAGLAGQDNRTLTQSALACGGQQLLRHLAHFAVEVCHVTPPGTSC